MENFHVELVVLWLLTIAQKAKMQNSTTKPTIPNFRRPIVTATIAFVLPTHNLVSSTTRNELRMYLADGLLPPNTGGPRAISTPHRLQVNPIYTKGLGVDKVVQTVFCSRPSKGLNAIFMITDKRMQGDDGPRIANMVKSLASTVGIPTLIWSSTAFELENADYENIDTGPLFLSPKLRDQAKAIFTFLKTQPLQKLSLLVSTVTPGYEIFSRALYEFSAQERKVEGYVDVHSMHSASRMIYTTKLRTDWRDTLREELLQMRDTIQTRAFLLYMDGEMANEILSEARTLGMTAEEYLWICTKPVYGESIDTVTPPPLNFVPGLIVVTYDISFKTQIEVLKGTTQVWAAAVRRLLSQVDALDDIAPHPFCDSPGVPRPWHRQALFAKLLREAKTQVEETKDNLFETASQIKLLYLDSRRKWVSFGKWTSKDGLKANATDLRKVRTGSKDTTLLRIVTLEEVPYVIYRWPDHDGTCPHASVQCEMARPKDVIGYFDDRPVRNSSDYSYTTTPKLTKADHVNGSVMCCSGFCIDLLNRLASDIGFRYHLYEVPDRLWGAKQKKTGEWNGLIKTLLDGEADMVMTSLKINKERAQAIDFSTSFLETGITMVVAVRPGAISAMAFLEPFSLTAWLAILLGCVNAVVFASFLFEYLSVRGLEWGQGQEWRRMYSYDQNSSLFSLFSSIWLVWAMLFKAAVKVRIPKSYGAKLLTGVWGAFSVIFASSYMANLAVFMITKDEFLDFSGIDDYRLKNPYTKNPPYTFATIGSGATEAFLRNNYPEMYEYMRPFNQTTVDEGAEAVKEGKLDAFIYDATVLDYIASRDKDCRLTTVGKWYAMTGYGIGFQKGSQWLPVFNKFLIDYQHSSFLQRLSDFWLSGACKQNQNQEKNKSFQLGVLNFTSAFILLFLGLAICLMILCCEIVCSKYIARHLEKSSVRERIKQQLFKSHSRGPSAKFDLATIGLNAIVCENCGGRGHSTRNCASPRMRLLGNKPK